MGVPEERQAARNRAGSCGGVTLAAQVMDKQECNEMLEELIGSLDGDAGKPPGVRLMVTGGACDDLAVFDLIEHLGYKASLVFADSCTAARYFWFEVPEGRADSSLRLRKATRAGSPAPEKTTCRARASGKGSGSSGSS